MSTILIIEDNNNIRTEVSNYFISNGFYTLCPEDFSHLEQLIAKTGAVLLDINLFEEDGFHICKRIREISQVPILFVTGRDQEADELRAMKLGGDDYVRKPYSLPVLLAKVKRMLERGNISYMEELTFEKACLNIVKGQLRIKEVLIELSKNEIKLLSCLFLNQDRVVSREEFIEFLWENKFYVDENIFHVNLSRLRKRLSDFGYSDFIETIPKEGYRLRKEDFNEFL